MCQLSFFHGESMVAKAFLMNLTLSNSSMNKDGHGYFILPNKLWKTAEDGGDVIFTSEYYDTLDDMIGDSQTVAIISHVRSASRGFDVCKENSHPFKIGHLVLVHNGTLEPDNEQDKIEKRIDSFWFLTKLSDIVKNKKLTPAHVAKAMESFRGKFVFLVFDTMQPNLLYIAKGKADLHYCRFINSKQEQVLFVINTSKINLEGTIAEAFYRIFTGENLSIDKVESFDDESIYIYDLNTSDLEKTNVKITERNIPYSSTVYTSYFAHRHQNSVTQQDRTSIITMCNELNLTFTEVNTLFEYITGSFILFADEIDVITFMQTLPKFKEAYSEQKCVAWGRIKTLTTESRTIDIYDEYGLEFPWMFETKKRLTYVLNRLSKRNKNR